MSSVADLDALFAEARKRKKKKRLQRDKRSDDDRAPTLSDVFVTGAKEEVPVRLATEGTLGSRLEGGATAGYSSSAPRAPSASVLYRRVAEGDAAQFAGARMDVGAHVLSLLQSHMGDTEANRAMERKLQNRTLALEGRRRGKDSAGGSKVAWAERSSRGDARLPTHVKSLSGKKRKALDRQEGGEALLGEDTIAWLRDAWQMHAKELLSADRRDVPSELVLLGAHAVVLHSRNAAQRELRGTIVKETEKTWLLLPAGKRRPRCIPKVTTVLGVPLEGGVLVVDGPTAVDTFAFGRKAPLSQSERKKAAGGKALGSRRREAFLAYHALHRREHVLSGAQGGS